MAGVVKRFSTGLLLLTCAILCLPTPLVAALEADSTTANIATAEMSGGDTSIQPADINSQSVEPVESSETDTVAATDKVADSGSDAVHLVAPQVLEVEYIVPDHNILTSVDENTEAGNENSDEVGNQETDSPTEQYNGVVITQVQVAGSGNNSATAELIEIRNNSPDVIDVTNWALQYMSAKGTSPVTKFRFAPDNPAPGHRVLLAADAYLVFVTNAFLDNHPEFIHSGIFASGLAAEGGRLLLVDQDGIMQTGVAWGNADSIQGDPVAKHETGELIERKLRNDGWHQDTKHNIDDFISNGVLRAEYKISSLEDAYDACLNLPGIDDGLIDTDWYRDDETGNCSYLAPTPTNICAGLQLSEIGANLENQFIEIVNSTELAIDLANCRLATDSNATQHIYQAELLEPGAYHAVYIKNIDLSIIKTTSAIIYLLSEDEQVEVDSTEYDHLKADTSWALIDEVWKQTYAPTPGAANSYMQYIPCDSGYARNIETGRCNKIAVVDQPEPCASNQFRNPATGRCKLVADDSTLTPCREGQYRHSETNRCRNIISTAGTLTPCAPGQYRNPDTNRCKSLSVSNSILQPCDDDQYRNPATNRCKLIASTTSTLKPCEIGYERNPETNRCRKSQSTAAIAGSAFPVEATEATASTFVGWWALGGVLTLGLAYAGWEWRYEMLKLFRRGA